MDAPEAQAFLPFLVLWVQEVLPSRNMDSAVFFFNWMVELDFILIPLQGLFVLSEIKSFDFKSPFLLVWCDPINEDGPFLFHWLFDEDSLSIFVLFEVVSLLTIATDLVKLRKDFMHIFN